MNQTLLDGLPEKASKTWKYHSFLENNDFEYANLYCNGKTLGEVCPGHLKNEWEQNSARLKAFYRSYREAKID